MPSAAIEPPPPPASCTDFRGCGAGLACMLVAILLLRGSTLDVQDRVLLVAASAAVPIGLFDLLVLRVHRRASTGLDWTTPFAPSAARVATKLLGLAVTLAAIALAYWTFPEYQGSFYDPWYRLLHRAAVPAAVLVPIYFAFVDGRQTDPRDAYWQIGRLLLGHPEDARRDAIGTHARGWLVKAFFLPLMIVYAHQEIDRLCSWHLQDSLWKNVVQFDFIYPLVFAVDLMFTTFGYTLSIRLMDTHVRSAEPTMLGWTVALFCYMPFFSLMEAQYVAYDPGVGFSKWLDAVPPLRNLCGGTILVLVAIYSLSTVAFGWRFSNLTNRGILTNGPYRFTKHPAYVTKNLSWWLMTVPFASHAGLLDGLRRSVLLALVNLVYFARARTEERHLSRDPTYVAYAEWMNEHGMFAWLGRLLPALRYRAPAPR
jgi:protein-S-isoprenylcysteine O-methyltransferase Ste14